MSGQSKLDIVSIKALLLNFYINNKITSRVLIGAFSVCFLWGAYNYICYLVVVRQLNVVLNDFEAGLNRGEFSDLNLQTINVINDYESNNLVLISSAARKIWI